MGAPRCPLDAACWLVGTFTFLLAEAPKSSVSESSVLGAESLDFRPACRAALFRQLHSSGEFPRSGRRSRPEVP
jgi:hypothetical protein